MKKFSGNNNIEVEDGWITSEDTTCGVYCDCGNETSLWVSNYEVVRCPICGKGYITEFVVWQYEKDENE